MQGIYAIRDLKAKYVGALMLFRHDAPAIRAFGDAASDPQTLLHRHPQDFELIRVGYLDDERHTIDAEQDPIIVMTGAAWHAAQTPRDVPEDRNNLQLARTS